MLKFEKLEVNGKKIQSPANQLWRPPPENFYKINIDGAYDPNTRTGEWGFVVRDSNGEVLLVGAGKISRAASAIQIEGIAALKAIQRAAQLGMTRIILETDASVLVSALRSIDIDRSVHGCLVRQIQDLMQMHFSCCSLSLCNRSCNKVANLLATYGASMLASDSEMYISQVPEFVKELVSSDLSGGDA